MEWAVCSDGGEIKEIEMSMKPACDICGDMIKQSHYSRQRYGIDGYDPLVRRDACTPCYETARKLLATKRGDCFLWLLDGFIYNEIVQSAKVEEDKVGWWNRLWAAMVEKKASA